MSGLRLFIFFCISIFILFGSCKKEAKQSTASGGTGSGAVSPHATYLYPTDADALFATVKERIFVQGTYDSTSYSSQASFYKYTGKTDSLTYAGLVSTNGQNVPFTANNNYNSSYFNYIGTGVVTWNVNDSAGQFGVFQINHIPSFVNTAVVDLGTITSINKATGFTITHPSLNADRFTYAIISVSNNHQVDKVVTGTSVGVTFSAQDLAPLDTGMIGEINILCYKLFADTINGKKIYFQDYSIINAGLFQIK